MRRNRNAKIIATLGPASSDRATIRALFEAGADVFRLNFSHGGHADHQARYEAIRAVEQEIGRPIGILADLQGPKLRIGTFAGGPIKLETGRPFRLDLDPAPGNAVRVRLPHPEIFAALHPGERPAVRQRGDLGGDGRAARPRRDQGEAGRRPGAAHRERRP